MAGPKEQLDLRDHFDLVFNLRHTGSLPGHALGLLLLPPGVNGAAQYHLASDGLDLNALSLELGTALQCLIDLALHDVLAYRGPNFDLVDDRFDSSEVAYRVISFLKNSEPAEAERKQDQQPNSQ